MPNKPWLASSKRRDEILDAAGVLFSTKGFHATSMRDIAQTVELQGGSLYAHIRSKQDLLFEIVLRAAGAFEAQAALVDSGLEAQTQLTQLVRGHLGVIAQQLTSSTVFFHEWKFLEGPRYHQIKALRDAYEGRFQAVIEQGVVEGAFAVASPRLATLYVLSALNGTAAWYSPSGKLSLSELSSHFEGFVLGSLR